jgi:GTP-binding protein
MGELFKVAIVGKPNVGKSTLFNRIIGRRKSLTFARPGITRDRVEEKVTFRGKEFIITDTGGYMSHPDGDLESLVTGEVIRVLESSNLVFLVLDGKEGVTSIDSDMVQLLRELNKDFLIALNKIDHRGYRDTLSQVYEMGVDNILEISAEHGTGVMELMEEIYERIEAGGEVSVEEGTPWMVSIVGRPNVGKSTLTNALIGEERMIASPQPGTTRDSIDSNITFRGKRIVLVDTAGIKPKMKTPDPVDKIMSIRSIRGLKRSQISILTVDSTIGLTHHDLQILRYIIDEGNGAIIAANKIDLLGVEELAEFLEDMKEARRFASYVPIIAVSALKEKGLIPLKGSILEVGIARSSIVKTSALNKACSVWFERVSIPRSRRGNRVLYMTQTGYSPPVFSLFVKDPRNIPDSFTRFVIRKIRDNFGFSGAPISIRYRKK